MQRLEYANRIDKKSATDRKNLSASFLALGLVLFLNAPVRAADSEERVSRPQAPAAGDLAAPGQAQLDPGRAVEGASDQDPATGKAGSEPSSSGHDKTAAQSPKFHKLGVSTSVLQEDGTAPSVSGGANAQVRTLPGFADTPVNHPFAALRAMFGSRGLRSSAYAVQDTGYGVCGFVLNVNPRGYTSIRQVFAGMPAAMAGVMPDDVVVHVNGKSTLNMDQNEVWSWFTGLPGTQVVVDILRHGQQFPVTMTRMDIGRIPDALTRAVFLDSFRKNGPSRFLKGGDQ